MNPRSSAPEAAALIQAELRALLVLSSARNIIVILLKPSVEKILVVALLVAVTGGAGFIGYWTVKALLESGYDVRVIDNLERAGMTENLLKLDVEFFNVDIRDYEAILKVFNGVKAVFHFAALIDAVESAEKPLLYHEVNTLGTLNVLKASVKNSVDKVIFSSSAAVYGEPKSIPVKETSPLAPLSFYGATKVAGETYCESFHRLYDLNVIIYRYFNVYGFGQSGEYAGVIKKFIDKIKEGSPLEIYGDGYQTRDFINIRDVVKANMEALNQNVKFDVFNIASGSSITINELAHLMLQISGKSLEIVHSKPRVGDVRRSGADISKAKSILGFKPSIELKEGLKELFKIEGIL